MIIDKGVDDEVLVLQTFGIQIDIAALIEEINSNSDQFLIHECETEILLGINRTDGINVEVLRVIDGNHRLLKRQELGRKMTNYIPINGSQLDPFVSEFS
ncbi:MAG: hypothetical protein P8X79_23215 [Reinekea sp.]